MPAVLKLVVDAFSMIVKMRELRKEGYQTFVIGFIAKSDKFTMKTWRRLKHEA